MKTLALMLAAVIGLTACNTMAGFGKDVEKTGEKIQNKAKK
jgi:predicted small secreted protein